MKKSTLLLLTLLTVFAVQGMDRTEMVGAQIMTPMIPSSNTSGAVDQKSSSIALQDADLEDSDCSRKGCGRVLKNCFGCARENKCCAITGMVLGAGVVALVVVVATGGTRDEWSNKACVSPDTVIDRPWKASVSNCNSCGSRESDVGCETNQKAAELYTALNSSVYETCGANQRQCIEFSRSSDGCTRSPGGIFAKFKYMTTESCSKIGGLAKKLAHKACGGCLKKRS